MPAGEGCVNAPAVLIVGAGAMGMVLGYYLQRGGTQVCYLVRPGRVPAFAPPRALYCYDDHTLKPFEGYRVVDTVSAAAQESFDYVMVTLDGAASRSDDGTRVIGELGCAIRDRATVMTMGGVGVGLREHYLRTTGLPGSRLLNAALGLLAHQVSAKLPVRPPTDPERLAQAIVAYRHFPNRASLMLDSTHAAAARALAGLYGRNGLSRAVVMPPAMYGVMSNAAFPMLAASQLAGWPSISGLVAQRELWSLSCRAQREIAALPRFGWTGRVLGGVMGTRATAWLHRKIEAQCLPLDYQAFNRFHHGGKVHAQDVQVLRNCLAEGRQAGHRMRALGELLDRLVAHEGSIARH
jgi:hypothetical protein